MKFDPAKPLELNLLDRPVTAAAFIEHTRVTTDPRPGWASPRRRPRRVYKKLAARDFKASFAPAPRFTGRSAALQQRHTVETAPGLVAWLNGRESIVSPYEVKYLPLMFDGKDPLRIAPMEFWGMDSFMTETFPPLPLLVEEFAPRPVFIERQITTWTGHRFGLGILINSPLNTRQIECSAVVYMPPGVDSAPVKQALERSAHALHKAIMLAARGMSYSKIVARQTCYRPTNP